jgi:hypothetical protein
MDKTHSSYKPHISNIDRLALAVRKQQETLYWILHRSTLPWCESVMAASADDNCEFVRDLYGNLKLLRTSRVRSTGQMNAFGSKTGVFSRF